MEELINELNTLKKEYNPYGDKDRAIEIQNKVKQLLQDAPDGTEMYRVVKETSSGWTSYGSYSDTRAVMKKLKKENGVWEMYGRRRDTLDDAMWSILYNDGDLMTKSDAQAELAKQKENDVSTHRDIVNVGTDSAGNPVGKSTNRVDYLNKKEESTDASHLKIENVTPIYTGGNIYVYIGELSDGNYFIASDQSFVGDYFDIRIVNENPADYEEDFGSVTWQEEHLVSDVVGSEAREFTIQLLEWVLENRPEGNYQLGDIEAMLDSIQNKVEESTSDNAVEVKWFDHRDYNEFRCDIIQGILNDGRQFLSGDYDSVTVYEKGYNAIKRLNDKAKTDDEDILEEIDNDMNNHIDNTVSNADLDKINSVIYGEPLDEGVLTPIPDDLKQPSEQKPWTGDMYMKYYFEMANAIAQEYKNGDIDFIKQRMKNYNVPEQDINDKTIKTIINNIAFAYADEKERRYKSLMTEAVDSTGMLVSTGLSDQKAEDILNSVIGQMSDGIWENTSQMNRFWQYMDIVKQDGELFIRVDTDNYSSGFRGYSADEVRKFVANKVKQIAKIYIEDYGHYVKTLKWDRNCTEECNYLDYHSGATIQDAYRVYDKLLGRKDRIKTEAKRVSANDLKIGDIYIDKSHNLQKVIDRPLPEKDLGITGKQLTKSLMPNKQNIKGTKWELEKIRPATEEDFENYPLIENMSSVDWEEEHFDLIWDEYAKIKAKELGIKEDEVDEDNIDWDLFGQVADDLRSSGAGMPDPDMYMENKEINNHREDKLSKLNSDILYNFDEAYKDWGKDTAPSKAKFIDIFMGAFDDDFAEGNVNWRDYIVAIPELDEFYKDFSDVEDWEIPEEMKVKFFNLINDYVRNYLTGVYVEKMTENKDNYVGQPLSAVLSYVGDGLDVADTDYDMMVWMPSYTEEDDLSDTFDKLIQLIEQKILVTEAFDPAEDVTVIADVTSFMRKYKQIFINELDMPEDVNTDADIEEYLVCKVFPSIVSGYATESLYKNLYSKINGGN